MRRQQPGNIGQARLVDQIRHPGQAFGRHQGGENLVARQHPRQDAVRRHGQRLRDAGRVNQPLGEVVTDDLRGVKGPRTEQRQPRRAAGGRERHDAEHDQHRRNDRSSRAPGELSGHSLSLLQHSRRPLSLALPRGGGRGPEANPFFHEDVAPSPLVGEGWGEGETPGRQIAWDLKPMRMAPYSVIRIPPNAAKPGASKPYTSS